MWEQCGQETCADVFHIAVTVYNAVPDHYGSSTVNSLRVLWYLLR